MLKKIVAREGLILLGVAVSGLAVYFIGRHLNSVYLFEHQDVKYKVIQNMEYALAGYRPYLKVMAFGRYIVMFGYPVIALIRFLFWSVKELRKDR